MSINDRNIKSRNKLESVNTYVRGLHSKSQAAPAAKTAAATITIANMLTGIITFSHSTSATIALTVDTGTAIDAGLPSDFAIGDSIDFSIIGLSAAAADTGTLTAATGVTLVGAVIISSAHSTTIATSAKRYRLRKTAAATYVIYNIG